MNLGIRGRLLVISVALITASVMVAGGFLSKVLDEELTARIERDLDVRADLVANVVEHTAAPLSNLSAWDLLADELGQRARARVTVIRTDGTVVGDSWVPRDELARLEDHSQRLEFVEALRAGEARRHRHSVTAEQDMAYVARRFPRSGEARGVARIAVPLEDFASAQARLVRFLAIATLLALAVAVIMSSVVAELASRGPRRLVEVARRLAAGKLEARAHARGDGELAAVGQTLDRLAEQLELTLEQLRAERDLVAGVLTAMQEGVLVLDGDKRVVMLNPAARTMLLVGDEGVGRPLLEVIRHAELDAVLDQARTGPVEAELEVHGIEPRRVLVHAATLPHQPQDVLAVMVDVTKVRRLESLRRDFVANVSHELRTPVTALRSAAETLRAGALADKEAAPRFLDIIERHATRLQSLIEDLLDLSRIESRDLKMECVPVDLMPLVARAAGLLEPLARSKKIELVIAKPVTDTVAVSDSRAIDQILGNLLGNAIKYCPEGSLVTVACESDAATTRLVVSDNGPGIGAEHLPRIFERFYRVDAGRSRDLGGTGLGLAIVKHLAEAMGGSVSVTSELGRGTTFTVRLKRSAAA